MSEEELIHLAEELPDVPPWLDAGGMLLRGRCEVLGRQHKGKEPVWGAVDSNIASLGLATKLGFRPVARIAVFTL